MRNRLIVCTLLALTAAQSAPSVFGQSPDVTINLAVTGESNWNTAANWLTNEPIPQVFVPGDNFPAEVVSISNGGTSFLNAAALFPVEGVLIGDAGNSTGALELRSGGSLTVVDSDPLVAGRNGILIVGVGGRGSLLVNGGTLNAGILAVGGQPTSTLTARGNGTITISGDAALGRIARVEGPNVNFTVGGNLSVTGEYQALITGAAHSVLKAPNGTAGVGGALTVEFSGVTPAFGNSWTLIDAQTVAGNFATVNAANASLPRGLLLSTGVNAAAGTLSVNVENRLILNVHRGTGAVSIENAAGGPIAIDGYTIASPGGYLQTGNADWNSLDDQNVGAFAEAAPTANFLSELEPTGSLNLTVGTKRALGTPYSFVPAEFAVSGDDISFEYTMPTGEILDGIVEYTGPTNNLTLTIDPDSGEGVMQNQSPFTIAIDGYQISSASGSLSVGGWNSLDDQNVLTWAEANPEPVALAELLPIGGYSLGPNASFDLGDLFVTAGMRDLRLDFTLADGTLIQGVVVYGAAEAGVLGDTDNDRDVDLDDLNNVRNNFGSNGLGDTDGDTDVDLDDLNNVRNNFGTVGSASVPEPSTFLLAAAGLIAVAGLRARRRG